MSQIQQAENSLGQLFSKKSMFLRTNCGTAKATDGTVYELTQSVNGSPLVMNKTTGKYWSISWQELIDLAKAAGIDTTEEIPVPEDPNG